jgi:hypothetical protein
MACLGLPGIEIRLGIALRSGNASVFAKKQGMIGRGGLEFSETPGIQPINVNPPCRKKSSKRWRVRLRPREHGYHPRFIIRDDLRAFSSPNGWLSNSRRAASGSESGLWNRSCTPRLRDSGIDGGIKGSVVSGGGLGEEPERRAESARSYLSRRPVSTPREGRMPSRPRDRNHGLSWTREGAAQPDRRQSRGSLSLQPVRSRATSGRPTLGLLVPSSRQTDLDPPGGHVGVFLLAHEVDLGVGFGRGGVLPRSR